MKEKIKSLIEDIKTHIKTEWEYMDTKEKVGSVLLWAPFSILVIIAIILFLILEIVMLSTPLIWIFVNIMVSMLVGAILLSL